MLSLNDVGISIKSKAFVVAEVSGNHDGKLENAIKLIHAAKEAGAQAVKFQTYTADSLSINVDNLHFNISQNSIWREFRNTHDLYTKASTPMDWLPILFEEARKIQILPFSSPFDEKSVEILEELNCEIYKVASPEINHYPLIKRIAKTGKPTIFSLGVAPESVLEKAIRTFNEFSNSNFALLQCDTRYPAEERFANIGLLPYLQRKFDCVVGISDHTTNSKVVEVAIGAGAKIFEKHIKLSADIGIDREFSLTPSEFKTYVSRIRDAELILGDPKFRYSEKDKFYLQNSRSIYASNSIEIGQQFSSENVRIVRPGYGLDSSKIDLLLSRKSKRRINKGDPITMLDLDE